MSVPLGIAYWTEAGLYYRRIVTEGRSAILVALINSGAAATVLIL